MAAIAQEVGLAIGDPVSVELTRAGVKLEAVFDAQSGSTARLRLPTGQRGRRLPLQEGDDALVIFDRFGSKFVHLGRFLGANLDTTPPFLTLVLEPGAPDRIERLRSTYRVTVSLRTEYEQLNRSETGPVRDGKLLDLSAGGAALELDRRATAPPVGTQLRLRFELPGSGAITTLGRITRGSPSTYGGIVGLQFRWPDAKMHDAAVRWIFAEQRRRATL